LAIADGLCKSVMRLTSGSNGGRKWPPQNSCFQRGRQETRGQEGASSIFGRQQEGSAKAQRPSDAAGRARERQLLQVKANDRRGPEETGRERTYLCLEQPVDAASSTDQRQDAETHQGKERLGLR
jgi:hypothetical protein